MGKGIISHKFTSMATFIRLGVQLGHIQEFFSDILHWIPTVHLIGKSDKCQYHYFIEEIETQKGNDLSAILPSPNGRAKPWCFHVVSSSSPAFPFLTGRHRTTVVRGHGYGFLRWLFNKRSGCKQTKPCWEFFLVNISYIATHVPKMPGLCEYLKLAILPS